MPITKNTLCVLPNPFAFLDHEGLPAATFPFDPLKHSPDRRWIGAAVDRSLDEDGKPRTRHLPQPGDLRARIRDTRPGAKPNTFREVHVDRSLRKRIVWAHDVDIDGGHVVPNTPHYRMGLRQRGLLPADAATAKSANVSYLEPHAALKAEADKAIDAWTRAHGEPPDTDAWPANLRAAAGMAPFEEDVEDVAEDEAPPSATPAPAAPPPAPKPAPAPTPPPAPTNAAPAASSPAGGAS